MRPRPLLLAAAALLLAGAGAVRPAPANQKTYCTAIVIGQRTENEPQQLKSVHVTAKDSIVFIPDEVSKPGGGALKGNEVTVCNWAGTGVPILVPPKEGLSPVSIHMPKGAPFHTLEVFVQQFYG